MVCSIVINSLLFSHTVIDIEIIKTFLLNPAYIPILFTSCISAFFKGISNTETNLWSVWKFPRLGFYDTGGMW